MCPHVRLEANSIRPTNRRKLLSESETFQVVAHSNSFFHFFHSQGDWPQPHPFWWKHSSRLRNCGVTLKFVLVTSGWTALPFLWGCLEEIAWIFVELKQRRRATFKRLIFSRSRLSWLLTFDWFSQASQTQKTMNHLLLKQHQVLLPRQLIGWKVTVMALVLIVNW